MEQSNQPLPNSSVIDREQAAMLAERGEAWVYAKEIEIAVTQLYDRLRAELACKTTTSEQVTLQMTCVEGLTLNQALSTFLGEISARQYEIVKGEQPTPINQQRERAWGAFELLIPELDALRNRVIEQYRSGSITLAPLDGTIVVGLVALVLGEIGTRVLKSGSIRVLDYVSDVKAD